MKISSIRISPTAEPQSAAKADQHSTINLPVRRSRGEGGSALRNYSVTSSSCVPSTSTLPLTRSRPRVMWSQ